MSDYFRLQKSCPEISYSPRFNFKNYGLNVRLLFAFTKIKHKSIKNIKQFGKKKMSASAVSWRIYDSNIYCHIIVVVTDIFVCS